MVYCHNTCASPSPPLELQTHESRQMAVFSLSEQGTK